MITGTFDRKTLTLTPDKPDWEAPHFAYDYGEYLFPKSYLSEDGRRIVFAWLNFQSPNKSWSGAGLDVPR